MISVKTLYITEKQKIKTKEYHIDNDKNTSAVTTKQDTNVYPSIQSELKTKLPFTIDSSYLNGHLGLRI